MKKILSFYIAIFTAPVLFANNCVINADLAVNIAGATIEYCKINEKCITKKVTTPYQLYIQNNDIEQPLPSVSYLIKKQLPVQTCYQDDFTLLNGKVDNTNILSLELILSNLSDKKFQEEPENRFSEENIYETIWLFQTIPDNRPPVLDEQGNLIVLRQKQNDYKEEGYLYSFNISQNQIKFNYSKDVNLSYGFDDSFYVKNDSLFEKYKNDDEGDHILVLGKYGDDQVSVKIDDENKENKKYQVCLYTFDYYPANKGYHFNKKNCVIYKDYNINQELYDKTYLNDKE